MVPGDDHWDDWDFGLIVEELERERQREEDYVRRGPRLKVKDSTPTLPKPSAQAGPLVWALYWLVRVFFFLRYGK